MILHILQPVGKGVIKLYNLKGVLKMYTFKDLRKASKQTATGTPRRLAILGNVSTQFLTVAIRGYAALEKLPMAVYDADYNQIEAQLLDPTSEVYGVEPDSILLWLATDKLYEEFLDLPLETRSGFATLTMQKITIISYVTSLLKK